MALNVNYLYHIIPDYSNFILAENEYAKNNSKNGIWYKIFEISDNSVIDTDSYRCLMYSSYELALNNRKDKNQLIYLGEFQKKKVYCGFSDESQLFRESIKITPNYDINIDDNYLTILYF